MNPAPAPSNVPEWSVSDLAGALKRTLEDSFGLVRVRGEVSGYRGPHSSGHAYFCLKDRDARIDAVVWRTTFSRLRFKPQEGLEVVATGRITTFPGKSTYQIVVDTLEPAGIGALMALLEERRRKLTAEGLFAAERKRRLPFLPKVIGVVTSPTGAVIRDILHRLEDRFPRRVIIWPVRVQGETCAAEVAAGIAGLNALLPGGAIPRPDVIIVARGGGSLEDLWGFNEEIVVRAAAASAIPLIAAIGHETDWTLLDHVADIRAPTPTGAAEMAVPVLNDLLATLGDLTRRHEDATRRVVENRRMALRSASRGLPSPDALFAAKRQRLDLASARLGPALERNARDHERRYQIACRSFARLSPATALSRSESRLASVADRVEPAFRRLVSSRRERFDGLASRLAAGRGALMRAERVRLEQRAHRLQDLVQRRRRAMLERLTRDGARLSGLGALLGSLSYRAVLARGFALVRRHDGHPVARAAEIAPGETLAIEFQDGGLQVVSQEGSRPQAIAPTAAPKPAPPRPARGKAAPAAQPSLFDD